MLIWKLYGIYINEQKLNDMNEQMYKQITALEQDIYELAGEIFNINSPKTIRRYFIQ